MWTTALIFNFLKPKKKKNSKFTIYIHLTIFLVFLVFFFLFFLQYVLFGTTSAPTAVILEQRYGRRVHVVHLGYVAVVHLLAERGGWRGRVVAAVLVPSAQKRWTPRR